MISWGNIHQTPRHCKRRHMMWFVHNSSLWQSMQISVRVAGFGRDFWKPSSPNLLLKQVHLQQLAQDHVQVSFESLQRIRLHNLPWQFVPVLCHSRSEEFHPVQILRYSSCHVLLQCLPQIITVLIRIIWLQPSFIFNCKCHLWYCLLIHLWDSYKCSKFVIYLMRHTLNMRPPSHMKIVIPLPSYQYILLQSQLKMCCSQPMHFTMGYWKIL